MWLEPWAFGAEGPPRAASDRSSSAVAAPASAVLEASAEGPSNSAEQPQEPSCGSSPEGDALASSRRARSCPSGEL
eukprot:11151459-Alexandrium_andersonii.AAC.1